MRVLHEPSFALPLVQIAVTFRSGLTSDPPGKEGLSRVTARMLRRGARGLSATQIEEAIDGLGGGLGADVGLSWTSLSTEVIERNLDAFVDRVATVIGEPTFDEVELARLLREAEGELIESRDNDQVLAGRALRRTLFEGHPYARRGGGYVESLRSITRDDVVAHYRRTYKRADAVVAVAGHIDEARARRVAERLLAALPEGERTVDAVPEPTMPAGRRLVFVDKPDRSQVQMYVGCLGTRPDDDDHTALGVANTVFGGTFTARLMHEIRSKNGWSYGAYSRLGIERHREAFTISTAPASHQAAMCLAREIELLEAWHGDGVTEAEVAFSKSYLARSYVFEGDTASKRVHQKLDAATLDLPEGYHERYVERVRAVTHDHASAAVRARVTPGDLVVAVVGTHDEVGAAIEAAIPGLTSKTVVPFDLE